jgi:hypothetical protein
VAPDNEHRGAPSGAGPQRNPPTFYLIRAAQRDRSARAGYDGSASDARVPWTLDAAAPSRHGVGLGRAALGGWARASAPADAARRGQGNPRAPDAGAAVSAAARDPAQQPARRADAASRAPPGRPRSKARWAPPPWTGAAGEFEGPRARWGCGVTRRLNWRLRRDDRAQPERRLCRCCRHQRRQAGRAARIEISAPRARRPLPQEDRRGCGLDASPPRTRRSSPPPTVGERRGRSDTVLWREARCGGLPAPASTARLAGVRAAVGRRTR